MSKKWVFGLAGILITTCLVVVLSNRSLYSQDQPAPAFGKNLKIFTGERAFKTQAELQGYMRGLTDALGVQCSYCHNMRDFTADEEGLHKNKAREMMTMTFEINEKYFKDHPDEQMSCFACHRGREVPVFSKQAWMDIQAKEANQ